MNGAERSIASALLLSRMMVVPWSVTEIKPSGIPGLRVKLSMLCSEISMK